MAIIGLRVTVAGPTSVSQRVTDGASVVSSIDTAIDAVEAGALADMNTAAEAIDTAIDALEAGSLADTIAAMAVLQADGALPTEAHVDTCDTALIAATAAIAAVQSVETAALTTARTALDAAIAALQTGETAAAAVAVAGDVVVYVDASTISANELRVAFEAIYDHLVRSRGALSLA